MKFKKKYEKIECSNTHVFELDYDGVIRKWTCVVLEEEVVCYERSQETARFQLTNREVAPQVLQLDTTVTIYGEEAPFQVENGVPFLKLQGEWVASDTFDLARREAAVRMYRRQSMQETIVGVALLAVNLVLWLVTGNFDDWWILSIFGIFMMSSAAYRMVRLRNELQALKEAELEAEAEAKREDVDGIAAARALKSGENE